MNLVTRAIRKMVAVYCKDHEKPTNTPCGKSEENVLFLKKVYKRKFVL
jgi:hypothetical protein